MLTRRTANKLLMGVSALVFSGTGFATAGAQKGRTLRIAVDNLWQTMSPINGLATTSGRIYCNFYERFTEVDYVADPSGAVVMPKLAISYERNEKVWTFRMREGVLFHNGEEMTAEDAAFTLSEERYRSETAFEPRGASFTEGMVRVEATDRYTLEIETAEVDPFLPEKLSGPVGMIVPKAYYTEVGVDAFGQMPIGTGPYKVTLFRPGEVMTMDAFPEYWGEQPPVASIEWRIVPEFAGRMAGVVSGEFDFTVNIPTDQEAQFASFDNVDLKSVQISTYSALAFNTRPDPENNPLVSEKLRYAMVQGVDMKTIVAALFGEASFHPEVPFNFPEYGAYYDPAMVSPRPYDPERARQLVGESGYDGSPLRWHITRGFYPNYELAAEIMVEQWREIGVNVEMHVLDNFSLVYERPYHLMNFSNGTSFIPGDPYQPLWLDWNPKATRSSAEWKTWDPTPEYIRLGEAFVKAIDFEERKAAYLALSAEWQRMTPALYLWKLTANFAHHHSIEWTPAAGEMRMYAPYLKGV
ncbi:ABC transporter substrate-binding protein [Agrobacterium tumefaciens]|nr:ABC transporter substrate-binding protein [Agrobacterium tumefaciens]